MRRNWIAGCLGLLGLSLIGYASFGGAEEPSFAPELARVEESSFLPIEEDLEGETPLFESSGDLAPAILTETPPAPSGEAPPAPPVAGAFEEVGGDHWVVRALREVFPDEVSGMPLGEIPENVTRYELAVALARVFEIYREDPANRPDLDMSRVALLEKLGNELREELSLLGVDQRSIQERVDSMAGRIGKVEEGLATQGGKVAALEKQVLELSRSLKGQETRSLELAQRMEANEEKQQTLEEKGKAVSEVVSRLVVKTAVAIAKKGTEASGVDEERLDALGERVRDLEEREVAAAEGPSPEVVDRMTERLQRLERLVVKAYERKGEATGSRIDRLRLESLRRKMDVLTHRLEDYRVKATTKPSVDETALSEVKDLMKGFFADFDRRLGQVERTVM